MKRIATRIAVSFVYCVLACFAASACASEETHFNPDASKACNPMFCPAVDMAPGCCLNATTCGVQMGNGCVPATKRDSGVMP